MNRVAVIKIKLEPQDKVADFTMWLKRGLTTYLERNVEYAISIITEDGDS